MANSLATHTHTHKLAHTHTHAGTERMLLQFYANGYLLLALLHEKWNDNDDNLHQEKTRSVSKIRKRFSILVNRWSMPHSCVLHVISFEIFSLAQCRIGIYQDSFSQLISLCIPLTLHLLGWFFFGFLALKVIANRSENWVFLLWFDQLNCLQLWLCCVAPEISYDNHTFFAIDAMRLRTLPRLFICSVIYCTLTI